MYKYLPTTKLPSVCGAVLQSGMRAEGPVSITVRPWSLPQAPRCSAVRPSPQPGLHWSPLAFPEGPSMESARCGLRRASCTVRNTRGLPVRLRAPGVHAFVPRSPGPGGRGRARWFPLAGLQAVSGPRVREWPGPAPSFPQGSCALVKREVAVRALCGSARRGSLGPRDSEGSPGTPGHCPVHV